MGMDCFGGVIMLCEDWCIFCDGVEMFFVEIVDIEIVYFCFVIILDVGDVVGSIEVCI